MTSVGPWDLLRQKSVAWGCDWNGIWRIQTWTVSAGGDSVSSISESPQAWKSMLEISKSLSPHNPRNWWRTNWMIYKLSNTWNFGGDFIGVRNAESYLFKWYKRSVGSVENVFGLSRKHAFSPFCNVLWFIKHFKRKLYIYFLTFVWIEWHIEISFILHSIVLKQYEKLTYFFIT